MNYCVLVTKQKNNCVFSNKLISNNELIGEYATYIPANIGRKLTNGMYETDILGRYCNHSTNSNTNFIYENDSILLYANTDINIGDEIVVNYFDFEKLTGVIYPHNWSVFDNTILTKFGS